MCPSLIGYGWDSSRVRVVYCNVKKVSILDEFVLDPLTECLGQCIKGQLIQISESYEVPMSTQARRLKETLLQSIVSELVEKRVLSPRLSMSESS